MALTPKLELLIQMLDTVDGTGFLNGLDSNFQKIDDFAANIIKAYADFASFPATGVAEKLYIAIDEGKFYHWDTVLSEYAMVSGGGSIDIADTAPVDPDPGAIWWDSTSGILKIYYDDGDSQQWVAATPVYLFEVAMQETAPTSPGAGDLWWDSENGVLMDLL